ncbi:hypothetical protein MYX07_06795 [Patescibacteria group bacterium AH-259-L07]|nr:hypothetical protein [Patescibacteria group bacterium AH-259-L07]
MTEEFMSQKKFKDIQDPEELLVEVVKILHKLKIPYVITGGFAVAIWGKPRFTADIDVVVELLPKNIETLSQELCALDEYSYLVVSEFLNSDTTRKGSGKHSFPVGVTGANKVSDARGRKPYGEHGSRALASDNVHVDMIKRSLSTGKEFNFIHVSLGMKVDFWIVDSEFDKKRISRAVRKKIKNQNVSFISPEDLVLSKLLWYKKSNLERELRDIQSVLKHTKVDLKYIQKKSTEQSTVDIFQNLHKKL